MCYKHFSTECMRKMFHGHNKSREVMQCNNLLNFIVESGKEVGEVEEPLIGIIE